MSKTSFENVLKRTVKNYNGKYCDVIKMSPEIYTLVTDLLFDRNIDQKHRTKLLVSAGYFLLPYDLYPENTLGPIGFIDDLMVIIFVLRGIRDEYGIDELMMYWKSDKESLNKILNEWFNDLLTENMTLYNEVISFVGF
jgi:uncharacterized membrane protein YkvA (DUF1232 family)